MSTEKLLHGQKILALEKKLMETINELNECKKENEDFIYIASHDLQAPLRKLSTFVERLTQKATKDLGNDIQTYVEKINITVADMRSLIDGLSELSDIEVKDTDFIKCDLNELLKEAIKDLTLLIKENNVDITVASLPTVEADPSQLKKVFINLIKNSVKFISNGKVPKIITTSELLSTEDKVIFNLPVDKVYYKIVFEDNGIGFNQKYADKIFKPFQRLHGKSTYTGNGLGLAICRKIIENHEGVIYAKANENSGARFILILPEMHTL